MMVVDLMHEFELGVWKTLFTHLMRILYAASERPGALVDELNARCVQHKTGGNVLTSERQVPPDSNIWSVYNPPLSQQCLGDEKTCRSRLRRHSPGVSMSRRKRPIHVDVRPGQCSIPAFEGLLPEPFNGMLLRLLYKAAEWHALAKLRLHTESTLDLLDAVTKEFGRLMRQFRDKTSAEYHTVELSSGADARNTSSSSKKKELNLNTYKFHALADYVATIRLFGTTDSYSTQIVRYPLVMLTNTHSLVVGRTCSSFDQTSIWVDEQTGCAWANRGSIPPREPFWFL